MKDNTDLLGRIKALPIQSWATPREVTFTDRDVAINKAARDRRAQGLRARIREARGVVSILRGSE